MVATIPLAVLSDDEVPVLASLLALLVVPVGLVIGFLIWQLQNWFIYGILRVDPWLYNKVFDPLSLAV